MLGRIDNKMNKDFVIVGLILIALSFFVGYNIANQKINEEIALLQISIDEVIEENKELSVRLEDYLNLYGKLKICPEQWIIDKMPCGGDICNNRENFVIDGRDRDSNEFDLKWIEDNCDINQPGFES